MPSKPVLPWRCWPGCAGNPSTTVHHEALVTAVQAFQARHALKPDGVIGRSTWAPPQDTPMQRVRQIQLTRERRPVAAMTMRGVAPDPNHDHV
jgi:murein L,D-transpeptidase YcbB/YkuD